MHYYYISTTCYYLYKKKNEKKNGNNSFFHKYMTECSAVQYDRALKTIKAETSTGCESKNFVIFGKIVYKLH